LIFKTFQIKAVEVERKVVFFIVVTYQ